MNAFNFAIADHYEKVDGAINYLIGLAHDDVDINDPEIFRFVLRKYNLLDDGFESEAEYIIEEVNKRL